jgi:hypothetical protein
MQYYLQYIHFGHYPTIYTTLHSQRSVRTETKKYICSYDYYSFFNQSANLDGSGASSGSSACLLGHGQE